jgi:hypothetical protein
MAAWRAALVIVAAWGGVVGCAQQVGGDLEGEGGEGGGRAFDAEAGVGGSGPASTASGETSTVAGPATTSATAGPATTSAASTSVAATRSRRPPARGIRPHATVRATATPARPAPRTALARGPSTTA